MPGGWQAVVVWTTVGAAVVAMIATTLLVGITPTIATPFSIAGIAPTTIGVVFWILITTLGSAWGGKEQGRAIIILAVAPIIAATVLGGPTAGAWVGLLGTFEVRELRGGVPWYGVLTNHAEQVVPAVLAGFAYLLVGGSRADVSVTALATAAAAATYFAVNTALVVALVWARYGRQPREALGLSWTSAGNWMVAQSAVAWLVSLTYQVVWWSPLALVAANASAAASLQASQAGWLVRHHQLTDLPNARSLSERATDLRRADRSGMCVFYIDLDGFKRVNDRYGHDVGDDVLKVVALRLRAAKRADDFLAHLHGDEFVLLAGGIETAAEAAVVVDRIESTLASPIEHPAAMIEIGASVGWRLVTDADTLDDALREADRAMRAAKGTHALLTGEPRGQREPSPTSLG